MARAGRKSRPARRGFSRRRGSQAVRADWSDLRGLGSIGHSDRHAPDGAIPKILERYEHDYATPDLVEAEKTVELTWDAFWRALKKAERQAI